MNTILPDDDVAGGTEGADEIVNNFDDEEDVAEFRNDFEDHMSELNATQNSWIHLWFIQH